MTEDEVRAMLRKAVDKAGGIRAWARAHRLTPAYVSDVLLGRRTPGPSICEPLGIEAERRVTIYRKIKRT